jgi:AcrR family transcriptional regulator
LTKPNSRPTETLLQTSGRKRKPRRSRKALRALLISTATKLFAANGYQGVTIRQIATKAKITLPAVYRIFENKRALYIACCEHELSIDLPLLHEALLQWKTPADTLYASTYSLFQWSSKDDRHIVMRAIMDDDTDMLGGAATSLFESNYIKLTLDAVRALSDKRDPVRNIVFIHSLIYAAPQIGSFWAPFSDPGHAQMQSGDAHLVTQVLATVIPEVDWIQIARRHVLPNT